MVAIVRLDENTDSSLEIEAHAHAEGHSDALESPRNTGHNRLRSPPRTKLVSGGR